MKARQGALTLIEAIIAFFIIALLAALLVVAVSRQRELANRRTCSYYLQQIARGCISYQEPSGDFFPACWDGKRFDPMMSLAMLYPAYVDDLKYFGCPSTADRPQVKATRFGGKVKNPPPVPGELKWTQYSFDTSIGAVFGSVSGMNKCSYFYADHHNFRDNGPGYAFGCDADGQTWKDSGGKFPKYPVGWQRVPQKPNHRDVQNVFYYDGHVKWTDTPYCSRDPLDNIFCPNGTLAGPWGADTDAYLWDGVNARGMEIVK